MGYIDTLDYKYIDATRTIEVQVSSLSEISEKPIIVTNHNTGGEQTFIFQNRTQDMIEFIDQAIGLKLIFRTSDIENSD